jgi:hypothetical protein
MSIRRAVLLVLVPALSGACREGESNAAEFLPIVAAPEGTQGCAAALGAPATLTPVFTSPIIGPDSQIAAVAGVEQLYLSGSDGSIHLLEFPTGGGAPSDTVWVASGVIETSYLVPHGIAAAARISGLAVLDEATLVVAEHSSNTLVQVDRLVPDVVRPFAGLPLAEGGNADGRAGVIRFHFSEPVALLATADGSIIAGDTGNHSLRLVAVGVLAVADTIAGTGAPGFADGALAATAFDTPSGLATSCPGELLVVESGAAALGGHRLRSLAVGGPDFFGSFQGSSMTLAGDGTSETLQGVDGAARLAAPKGIASTSDGQVFWVDSATGILRRYDFATGLSDCPPFADCAAAVAAGGSFASGGGFSLALGDSGALYVLDAAAGTLFRVEP